jgi:ACR3 family arsenite efflux pump ArsB
MFALQGQAITSDPLQVLWIAIPLFIYFVLMWSLAFVIGRCSGLDYRRTSSLAFTAAGNNFELAIAVSISVWGVTSQQALAGVVGPLIEVPVLVGLVYVSRALRRWFPLVYQN